MADKDFVVKNGLVTGSNSITLGAAVTVIANGNMGIGNSSPSAKLQVDSPNAANQDTIFINQAGTAASMMRFKSAHSANSDWRVGASINYNNALEFCSVSGLSTIMSMFSNGTVGIGTGEPLKRLSIKTSTANAAQLHLEQENATDGWDFNATSAGGHLLIDRYAGGTASTKMFLGATGNVGIGNTGPSHLLSVNGNTYIGGNTTLVGTTSVSNTVSVTGNATFSNTLSVTGATTISNTINVTGATTISNTVSVTGSINYTGSLVKSTVTQQTIETGTRMVFQQTAAPTGFTKDTGYNDYAMRIVSGAVSYQGGASGFNTVFASRGITGTVDGTTLSTSQIPSHSHSIGRGDRTGTISSMVGFGSNDAYGYTNVGSTGGGGSHNHSFSTSLNMSVNYIDFILATAN